MEKAAREGGMGFAQEMMIHNGKAVNTKRSLGNKNVFRALCLDSEGERTQKVLFEDYGIVWYFPADCNPEMLYD